MSRNFEEIPELLVFRDLAIDLWAEGLVSSEVLAIIETGISEIGVPVSSLDEGWVTVFERILDIAALKAIDNAWKTAVANEIATLAVAASKRFPEVNDEKVH